jgi:hypothetical protein
VPKTVTVTAAPPKLEGTINDVVYVIGEDVPAGRYKTAGPDDSNPGGSYYALKNGEGADADILSNNIMKARATASLKKRHIFESTGSDEWNRAG